MQNPIQMPKRKKNDHGEMQSTGQKNHGRHWMWNSWQPYEVRPSAICARVGDTFRTSVQAAQKAEKTKAKELAKPMQEKAKAKEAKAPRPPRPKKPKALTGTREDEGRRVIVPQAVWPNEPCKEHKGRGWTAEIVKMHSKGRAA